MVFDVFVVVFFVPGGNFYTMFGAIFVPNHVPGALTCTPSQEHWCHFGVILVPLGVIWRPGAPQGTPQGSRVEKVTKKLVRGSFVGPPLGPLLEPKSVTNRKKIVAKITLKNIARKVLHKRSPKTTRNHENDGFA